MNFLNPPLSYNRYTTVEKSAVNARVDIASNECPEEVVMNLFVSIA